MAKSWQSHLTKVRSRVLICTTLFAGEGAESLNTLESNNKFIGAGSNGVAGISNATALGYQATVSQSNSLVLGNNNVSVGIGVLAPKSKLHVTGGRIYVEANGMGVILKSPGGSCYELTVTSAGTLLTTPLVCP